MQLKIDVTPGDGVRYLGEINIKFLITSSLVPRCFLSSPEKSPYSIHDFVNSQFKVLLQMFMATSFIMVQSSSFWRWNLSRLPWLAFNECPARNLQQLGLADLKDLPENMSWNGDVIDIYIYIYIIERQTYTYTYMVGYRWDASHKFPQHPVEFP